MLGNLLKSYNGNQLGEMSGNFQKKNFIEIVYPEPRFRD